MAVNIICCILSRTQEMICWLGLDFLFVNWDMSMMQEQMPWPCGGHCRCQSWDSCRAYIVCRPMRVCPSVHRIVCSLIFSSHWWGLLFGWSLWCRVFVVRLVWMECFSNSMLRLWSVLNRAGWWGFLRMFVVVCVSEPRCRLLLSYRMCWLPMFGKEWHSVHLLADCFCIAWAEILGPFPWWLCMRRNRMLLSNRFLS